MLRDLFCGFYHLILFLIVLLGVNHLFIAPTVLWFVCLVIITILSLLFAAWDLNRVKVD